MRKKCVLIWCVILVGVLFSCSELVLPNNVEVSGSLNVPLNVRVTNINSLLSEAMEKAFPTDREETKDLKVYQVEYQGQTVEAFCIYIPIEMTEDLNPDHFLKIINTQINDGLSADPKNVSSEPVIVPPVLPPFLEVDLSEADNLIEIPEISLDEIARYVISIDFDECDGTTNSGIGINFHLHEIIPGIKMTLRCEELDIDETKILAVGDNIFGNRMPLTEGNAFFMQGPDGVKTLNFEIELKSADTDSNLLRINTEGLSPGDEIELYNGDIIFFNKWIKATIDMHEAIKGDEGLTGEFPQDQDGFDLSELGKYFEGFTFEGMEARLYVSGSPIGGLEPDLILHARYHDKEGILQEGLLYEGSFEIDSTPLVLDDNYISNESYKRKHLPGIDDNQPEFIINQDTLTDIFLTMPESLFFSYEMVLEDGDTVDIYPEYFVDDPDAFDSSKIAPALLIMMPMHLTATKDGSIFSLPDMFDDMKDLFDRDKPETLFESMDIKTLTMSIEFLQSFFTGGSLFLDGDKETAPLLFYPNGIKLGSKKMIVDFDKTQRDIVEKQLIKPNIWFKFKKDNEVIIPKKLGVVSISFEVGGILNLGDILE
jgi:hypothetical protein